MNTKPNQKLTKNIDYYINESGQTVLTEKYLKERGHCCQSGCKHCPYPNSNKDPNIPAELNISDEYDSNDQDIEREDD